MASKEFLLESFLSRGRDGLAKVVKSERTHGLINMALKAAPLVCGVIMAANGYLNLGTGAMLWMADKAVDKIPNRIPFWDAPAYMAGWKEIKGDDITTLQAKIDASKGYIGLSTATDMVKKFKTRDV
jgi:hypothetical protein